MSPPANRDNSDEDHSAYLRRGCGYHLCANVEAQQSDRSIPPEVTDKLAEDLARLQSEIQAAQQQAAAPTMQKEVVVTRDGTWVFGGADPAAPKEFSAQKGQDLKVLDKAGNWYAVGDATGKTGWVPVADVKPKASMPGFGYSFDYFEKIYPTSDKPVQSNQSSVFKTIGTGGSKVSIRIYISTAS
jgi:uncharacterized protein YgiM (DUF1202 family)